MLIISRELSAMGLYGFAKSYRVKTAASASERIVKYDHAQLNISMHLDEDPVLLGGRPSGILGEYYLLRFYH